jgi:hypothetical protein
MRNVNIMQGTNLGGMEQASLRYAMDLHEWRHSYKAVSSKSGRWLSSGLQGKSCGYSR